MYETFYQLRTNPFSLTPDTKICFSHSGYRQAREYLEYALKLGEGVVMVTGRPGTGKTTLVETFLDTLNMRTVVAVRVAVSTLDTSNLLRAVAYAFDLDAEGHDKATLRHLIRKHLEGEVRRGRRALLIIDEAQGLSRAGLDELRLLADLQLDSRQLLQLFLIGQEQLHDQMSVPEMDYFQQRVIANYHLVPLGLRDTRAYMEYRLRQAGWRGDPELTGTAVLEIYRYSQGVPRHINKLCSRLLLLGYGLGAHTLDSAEVQTIMAEMNAEQLRPVVAGPVIDEMPELQAGVLSKLAIRVKAPARPVAAAAGPDSPGPAEPAAAPVPVNMPVPVSQERPPRHALPAWAGRLVGQRLWRDRLAPALVVVTVAALTVLALSGISDYREGHRGDRLAGELHTNTITLPLPGQDDTFLGQVLSGRLPASAAGQPLPDADALVAAAGLPDSPRQAAQDFSSGKSEIDRLLARGRAALLDNRLLTPALDSAYYYYQGALRLEPGNAAAIAGIEQIVEHYVALTNRALELRDETRAYRYIVRGLSIQPDNSELLALKERSREPLASQGVDEGPEPAAELASSKNIFSRIRTFFVSNSRRAPETTTSFQMISPFLYE